MVIGAFGTPVTMTNQTEKVPPIRGEATIVQKIARVMLAISHIDKEGNFDTPNVKYKFAKDSDVLHTVRRLIADEKLVVMPGATGIEQQDGKTLIYWEMLWVCGDTGATLSRPWVSEAEDKRDKGIGKAATSALKYYLLKTLMIPTEKSDAEDPDNATEVERGVAVGKASTIAEVVETMTVDEEVAAVDAARIALARRIYASFRLSEAQSRELKSALVSLGVSTKFPDWIVERYQRGDRNYDALVGAVDLIRAPLPDDGPAAIEDEAAPIETRNVDRGPQPGDPDYVDPFAEPDGAATLTQRKTYDPDKPPKATEIESFGHRPSTWPEARYFKSGATANGRRLAIARFDDRGIDEDRREALGRAILWGYGCEDYSNTQAGASIVAEFLTEATEDALSGASAVADRLHPRQSAMGLETA